MLLDNIKVLHSRSDPYPHDRLISRLVLWIFPKSVKPNHITIFRMLATPFVFLFIIRNDFLVGMPAFVIVAFTDVLDGTMARMRNQITAWGTLFDPIADKFLVGGVLFILMFKYISVYIAAAVIILEFVVIIGGWLKGKNGVVVSAGKWGKTKMFLQVVGVSLLLLSVLLSSPMIMIIAEWTLILSISFSILNIFEKGFVG